MTAWPVAARSAAAFVAPWRAVRISTRPHPRRGAASRHAPPPVARELVDGDTPLNDPSRTDLPTVRARHPATAQGRTRLLTPVRLLESHYQHRRVAALIALAGNPHTPRTAVTELAWICHQDNLPDRLHTAATALAPADGNEAVLRLLTDDELDHHPEPGAVLQSWLDAPETEGVWTDREVYRAVLNSRHHTRHHLRQLPADEVLDSVQAPLPRPAPAGAA
ncbi:hypothetical protein ACWCQW_39470 [Streptomyces mirabilis]